MMYIILTQEQAQQVAGQTAPAAMLVPRQLKGGVEWVLPVAVLDDAAHSAHHGFLSALPVRDVAASEFPAPVAFEP